MYQVTFQNRTKTVETLAEVAALRSRWGAGKSRKLVERFFQVREI